MPDRHWSDGMWVGASWRHQQPGEPSLRLRWALAVPSRAWVLAQRTPRDRRVALQDTRLSWAGGGQGSRVPRGIGRSARRAGRWRWLGVGVDSSPVRSMSSGCQ
jgi:hypothetical protein